jgi:hypothetical protein
MQALEWQTLLSVLDERILIEADKTMLSMLAISIHEFKRQSTALSKEGMTNIILSKKVHRRDKGHRHRLSCFWFLMHSLACFFSFFFARVANFVICAR